MANRFSIKSLMALTAIVAVLLAAYLFRPDAVERRRLHRDTYSAWEINQKIRIFEESHDHSFGLNAKQLLDGGIINNSDFEFLNKHRARIFPVDERPNEIAVRIELLIKNYRTLCFSDGSVFIFRENENGYETMPLMEFWKIRKSREPRIY